MSTVTSLPTDLYVNIFYHSHPSAWFGLLSSNYKIFNKLIQCDSLWVGLLKKYFPEFSRDVGLTISNYDLMKYIWYVGYYETTLTPENLLRVYDDPVFIASHGNYGRIYLRTRLTYQACNTCNVVKDMNVCKTHLIKLVKMYQRCKSYIGKLVFRLKPNKIELYDDKLYFKYCCGSEQLYEKIGWCECCSKKLKWLCNVRDRTIVYNMALDELYSVDYHRGFVRCIIHA